MGNTLSCPSRPLKQDEQEKEHCPKDTAKAIDHELVAPSFTNREYWNMAQQNFVTTWPTMLGNILEWYEWSLYGYTSLQMNKNFFRGSELATWAAFALPFASRPLGAFVIGGFCDRYGRKAGLLLCYGGMLTATVSQAFLPTVPLCGNFWGNIGLGMLLTLRLCQGIVTGGQVAASHTFIAEAPPKPVLGILGAWLGMGGTLGFIASNGVFALLSNYLTEDQLLNWGWRIPYLLALAPGLVAVTSVSRLQETDAFNEAKAKEAGEEPVSFMDQYGSSLRNIWTNHKRQAILVFGLLAGGAANTYLGSTYMVSNLVQHHGFAPNTALTVTWLSQLAGLILWIPSGYVTDRLGPMNAAKIGSLLHMVAGIGMYTSIQLFPNPVAVVITTGIICPLLTMISTPGIALTGMFPTELRAAGMGTSYNLSVYLFGGMAPMFATMFTPITPLAPGIFISFASLITFLTTVIIHEDYKKGKYINYVRSEPYPF